MKNLLLIFGLFAAASALSQSDSVVIVFNSEPFPQEELSFVEITWVNPDGVAILDLDRLQLPFHGTSSPHLNKSPEGARGNKWLLEAGTVFVVKVFDQQGDHIDTYIAYVTHADGELAVAVIGESDRVGYHLYDNMREFYGL